MVFDCDTKTQNPLMLEKLASQVKRELAHGSHYSGQDWKRI